MPEEFGRQRPALELEGLNGAAERNVRGIERLVHVRREAGRHVPIVGFGQDVKTAGEAHAAVADRLAVRDRQQAPLLLVGRLVGAEHPFGPDRGRHRQTVSVAPALERQRGAVVAQEVGLEVLDESERREARGSAVRPGGARQRHCVLRESGLQRQQDG